MWRKRKEAKGTRAWGSNFAMKNSTAKHWPATGKKWVDRVFFNTRTSAGDRLRRLFLRALVREDLPISNQVPARLTQERKRQ